MTHPPLKNAIVILDFGGQYAHLIASRIRRFGYKAYIVPTDTKAKDLTDVAGIIFSGGPQSVYEKGSPTADTAILDIGVPVLGLCYGHQWVAHALGGKVTPAKTKEYGPTSITVLEPTDSLFHGLPKNLSVWMSHGDEVSVLPDGFVTVASSKDCTNAAFMNLERKIYGIQFHIEVTHTEHGMDLLRNFVDRCSPEGWDITSYKDRISEDILRDVGEKKVFMLVSGGVDSTVAFTLLNKVLGPDRVTGLLVDTGLMRQNEVTLILDAFKPLGISNLHVTDASEEFFKNLQGIYDPEEKRKIIGNTFLDVQKRVFNDMGLRIEDGWMLGQGTIYPDTIETGGTKHADTIKTHHNRVPMIQDMIEQGLVIEPLKELYKDEVRQLGEELGLPHDLVWRHPFPGPGLGVRILCALSPSPSPEGEGNAPQHGSSHSDLKASGSRMTDSQKNRMVLPVQSVGVQGDGRTYRHALALFSDQPTDIPELHWSLATSIPNEDRSLNRVLQCLSHAEPFATHFAPTYLTRDVADLLREADAIVDLEMRRAKLYKNIWQFPVVLLPFGASEGARSIVLRPIESTDAMTARAYPLPQAVLAAMTKRLLVIDGLDAVFLDLTNKPPGTIEWE